MNARLRATMPRRVGRFWWRFEVKRQDAWIGAFWKTSADYHGDFNHVWVCLLPMVPLHVWWLSRRNA